MLDFEDNLEDYFMFPWEAVNSLKELRNYWEDLRNQVAGRGLTPRTDVPKDLQMRIMKDYKAFRRWETEVGFWDRATGIFQDELARYSQILSKNWTLFNNWLEKKNKEAKKQGYAVELPPPEPPIVSIDEIISNKTVVSLGSVAAIVGVGIAAYLLWPVIKKRRRSLGK